MPGMGRTVKPAVRKYLAKMALSLGGKLVAPRMVLAFSVLSALTWFCATLMIGVLYFFSPDDLGFAFAALHHERRRALRMNEVAAALGKLRNALLIGGHHGGELVFRAAADIQEQGDEPDAFRQQAHNLLGHARTHRRIDHAHDAAPAGECHAAILVPGFILR